MARMEKVLAWLESGAEEPVEPPPMVVPKEDLETCLAELTNLAGLDNEKQEISEFSRDSARRTLHLGSLRGGRA